METEVQSGSLEPVGERTINRVNKSSVTEERRADEVK